MIDSKVKGKEAGCWLHLPRAAAVRTRGEIGVARAAPVTVSARPADCSGAGAHGVARTVAARTGPYLNNRDRGSAMERQMK